MGLDEYGKMVLSVLKLVPQPMQLKCHVCIRALTSVLDCWFSCVLSREMQMRSLRDAWLFEETFSMRPCISIGGRVCLSSSRSIHPLVGHTQIEFVKFYFFSINSNADIVKNMKYCYGARNTAV